jgi:hypothetical protein
VSVIGGVLKGDGDDDDDDDDNDDDDAVVLVAIFLAVGGDPTTICLRIEVPGPGGDAMGGRGNLGFMVSCGAFRGNATDAICGLSEGGGGGGGPCETRGGDNGPSIPNVSVVVVIVVVVGVVALVGIGDAPVIMGLIKDRMELERRFMEEMDRNES